MNVQNSTMVPLTRSGSLLTRQYISFSEQRAGRERLTLILRGVERLSPDEIEEGNIIFDLVFRDAEQLTMSDREDDTDASSPQAVDLLKKASGRSLRAYGEYRSQFLIHARRPEQQPELPSCVRMTHPGRRSRRCGDCSRERVSDECNCSGTNVLNEYPRESYRFFCVCHIALRKTR
jgi:hypothetical protein